MRAVCAVGIAALLPLLASAMTARAGATAPPLFPGAVATARPAGVGFKAPPSSSKTYVTPDGFSKVKAWYKAHLPGAQEIAQPGMEKTEDAFLVGHGASGMVVMVQSYKGKTYIIIGPPM
ncbi:MAG TPA: hypothetical protein VGZ02_02505 [Candidatus Baltobacteraceae bacterium]|nr:hypothetical protein [Candidatus Baltobacteraceae bacterium]